MERSFLIIGTGELGLAMLNSLLQYQKQHGLSGKIGVLVKPSHKDIEKFRGTGTYSNVILEQADLVGLPIKDLAVVLKKYDTVICCSGFSIGKGMQVKITKAVLEAGVRKYVPWQFGADYDKIGRGSAQPVFDEQLDVRDLLRGQDKTHWVIVSTGMFTSFLFREDFGIVNLSNKTVYALGDWNNSLTLTTCEDVGALTIKALFHEPEILDQVVFVAGDTLTFKEIGEKMEKMFFEKFDRLLWDIPTLENNIRNNPDDVLARYRLVFTDSGVTWPVTETFNFKNNIEVVDVEQWVQKNLL